MLKGPVDRVPSLAAIPAADRNLVLRSLPRSRDEDPFPPRHSPAARVNRSIHSSVASMNISALSGFPEPSTLFSSFHVLALVYLLHRRPTSLLCVCVCFCTFLSGSVDFFFT